MKLLAAVAVSVLLAAGVTYAQNNSGSTDSGASAGSGTDAANDLTRPNIQRFYQDEGMSTMKSGAEVKSTFEGMSAKEQANLRQACMGNKDNRWSTLCNSIGSM